MSVKNSATRVLIVDDHPLLREGIATLIGAENDFEVCGQVDDSKHVISSIQKTNPDVVLLDISLKGASGVEVLKDIKALFPKLRVLVLSMHDETVFAPRVLRAGAMGYVMKHEAPGKIIDALRKVRKDEVVLSQAMGTRLLNSFTGRKDSGLSSPVDLLSDRELEVFTLIGQGHGTRDVAEKIGLSVKTIESHRAHIKEKLNLGNAAELVRHAIEWVSSEGFNGKVDTSAAGQ